MDTIELHPEILTKNGQKFAVLPYSEFEKLQELLEDARDLYDLEEAIRQDDGSPGIPLEEVLKRYGLTPAE